MSDELRYERVGAAAVLTIDRPERRNAVDAATAELFRQGLREFEADEGARVLVLTGAGGEAFCAGADLKAMNLDVSNPDGPMGPTRLTPAKPAIAAIEGWCLAGGVELALWCDMRIATRGSTFGLFERRWGVPLLDGGTQRLPRVVGMGRALEMILTGRPVDAEEAHRIGLVNEVVEPGRHLERALELAEQIASFPQETMLADRRGAIEGYRHAARRGPRPRGAASATRCSTSPSAAPPASPAARAATAPSRRSSLGDPAHLVSCGLRPQVGHQHREDKVGQNPLQLGAAAGADLVEDHRGAGADREARGVGGRSCLAAELAPLLEEGVRSGPAPPRRAAARRRRPPSPRPSSAGRCRPRRRAARPAPAGPRRSVAARARRRPPT